MAVGSLCGFAFPLNGEPLCPPETSLSRLIALALSGHPCGASSLTGYSSKV